jgi:glutamyl-tRNA reductase
MGALAVRALRTRGAGTVLVANRTLQTAQDLTARWGGEAVPFEQLPLALTRADAVIVCTGAAQPVVTAEMVRDCVSARGGGPLLLVDISVPRNVAPEVTGLPGVTVLDMDHLTARVQEGLNERILAIPQAEQVVRQEAAAFADWLDELETLDLIAELHKKADTIRQHELQRTLRYLPDLDPQAQQHIRHLTQSLMDKLLHEPTQRLRTQRGADKRAIYADAVRELFGLDAGAGVSAGTAQGGEGACR